MRQVGQSDIEVSQVMSRSSMTAYLQHERERGASEDALRRCRRTTEALYEWLPEDKAITRERLLAWREHIRKLGYAPDTERNYVKGINRYLDYIGCGDLRFQRGRAKDISGMEFGYLTAIAPTGEKERKDLIWRCRCRCGKEATFPATRLLTGNTLSCGCLRAEHLKSVNKYIDGTSIRQALEEQVFSTRAASGYTGVTMKNGKWKAYIRYKGKNVSLGCYTNLEDAVKARARGKELVQADALGLLDFYEELHKEDPPRPNREEIRRETRNRKPEKTAPSGKRAVRSNNTSGCTGVFRKGNRWMAKITFQRVNYPLGSYEKMEEAVAARREAEQALEADPAGFPEWAMRRPEGQEGR